LQGLKSRPQYSFQEMVHATLSHGFDRTPQLIIFALWPGTGMRVPENCTSAEKGMSSAVKPPGLCAARQNILSF
jgi:hypothetical protein